MGSVAAFQAFLAAENNKKKNLPRLIFALPHLCLVFFLTAVCSGPVQWRVSSWLYVRT